MVEVVINQNDGFVSITAVGGETNLDFDFPIYEKAHLRIIRTRSGTDADLVLDTDYTIATNQLELTAGGRAVLLVAATAGDIYSLLLNTPESRTTDFNQAGDFFAATINRELDLQTQQIQALRRDVDKSARLPDSSTISSLPLPTPTASRLIGWNAGATALANYATTDLSGTTVTAFATTLLDDATATQARATLGAVIGTNVQAYDAELAAIAGLTSAANTVPVFTGSGTAALVTLAASQLLGRGSSGNVTNCTLGSGLAFTAGVLNTVTTSSQLQFSKVTATGAFTFTTSANVTAATKFLFALTAGGGGGGAGATAQAGPGGGAGATSFYWVSGLAASTGYSGTVGAGGAGGSSGAGANGTDSTLVIGATTVTSGGGVGGVQGTTSGASGGAGSTTTTNATLGFPGGGGGAAGSGSTTLAIPGQGGSSVWGGSSAGIISAGGGASVAYGAGGPGGGDDGGGATSGGAGAPGVFMAFWLE